MPINFRVEFDESQLKEDLHDKKIAVLLDTVVKDITNCKFDAISGNFNQVYRKELMLQQIKYAIACLEVSVDKIDNEINLFYQSDKTD